MRVRLLSGADRFALEARVQVQTHFCSERTLNPSEWRCRSLALRVSIQGWVALNWKAETKDNPSEEDKEDGEYRIEIEIKEKKNRHMSRCYKQSIITLYGIKHREVISSINSPPLWQSCLLLDLKPRWLHFLNLHIKEKIVLFLLKKPSFFRFTFSTEKKD